MINYEFTLVTHATNLLTRIVGQGSLLVVMVNFCLALLQDLPVRYRTTHVHVNLIKHYINDYSTITKPITKKFEHAHTEISKLIDLPVNSLITQLRVKFRRIVLQAMVNWSHINQSVIIQET